MRQVKKYVSVLLACVMVCMLWSIWSEKNCAAVENKGILVNTLHAQNEYRIYLVAEKGAKDYELTKEFHAYPVDICKTDLDNMIGTAQILDAYIRRDGINPVQTQVSNQDGQLHFNNLQDGLYLIVGDSYVQNGYKYVMTPILQGISKESEFGEDGYLEIYAKLHQVKEGEATCSVVKMWEDYGHESSRPEEIVVQLLRDCEVYEEVTLNAENNWSHCFYSLSSMFGWTVVEKDIYEGYNVKLGVEDNYLILINTYDEESEDSETIPEEKPQKPDEVLPQTGQLWWPVPVLGLIGCSMIVCGVYMNRKSRNDE